MAKFVVLHSLPGPFDPEAATPIGKAVKACCSADAYWIRSTVVPGAGKMYCEWDAKDVGAIESALAAAAKITPQFPTDGIYEIAVIVNGEDFR